MPKEKASKERHLQQTQQREQALQNKTYKTKKDAAELTGGTPSAAAEAIQNGRVHAGHAVGMTHQNAAVPDTCNKTQAACHSLRVWSTSVRD